MPSSKRISLRRFRVKPYKNKLCEACPCACPAPGQRLDSQSLRLDSPATNFCAMGQGCLARASPLLATPLAAMTCAATPSGAWHGHLCIQTLLVEVLQLLPELLLLQEPYVVHLLVR